jgi:hypothetical protein
MGIRRIIAAIAILSLVSSVTVRAGDQSSHSSDHNDWKNVLDTLAGPLPSIIKAQARPYLVLTNIEVPIDKTVTIEPGTVFLFRNFAGLHIQGKLIAEGTRLRPIIFTSEFDRVYAPESERDANPFDWDGIYIHNNGFGSRLSYCGIFYSVYGLSSETKFIRLDPLVFKNNGKKTITIDTVTFPITTSPFQYVLSTKDALQDGVPVEIIKDPLASRRAVFRYSGIALFLAGCTVGIIQANASVQSVEKVAYINDLSVRDTAFFDAREHYPALKHKRNIDIITTGGSFLLAIFGAVGFGWSFTF